MVALVPVLVGRARGKWAAPRARPRKSLRRCHGWWCWWGRRRAKRAENGRHRRRGHGRTKAKAKDGGVAGVAGGPSARGMGGTEGEAAERPKAQPKTVVLVRCRWIECAWYARRQGRSHGRAKRNVRDGGVGAGAGRSGALGMGGAYVEAREGRRLGRMWWCWCGRSRAERAENKRRVRRGRGRAVRFGASGGGYVRGARRSDDAGADDGVEVVRAVWMTVTVVEKNGGGEKKWRRIVRRTKTRRR